MTSRIAVVGNDPAVGDYAREIDAADIIVRFNNAFGFGAQTGKRVTHLVLVNRGGQMREWIEDPVFLQRPVFAALQEILLPFPELPPEGPDVAPAQRVCWTREALTKLEQLGVPIRVLPRCLHSSAHASLRDKQCPQPNPSTGFLVTYLLVRARQPGAPPIDAYGFGFSGWTGHPWDAERRRFAAFQAEGRMRLHPPASRTS